MLTVGLEHRPVLVGRHERLIGEREQRGVAVRQVLDSERPAHTAYELCTVDAGMRLGRGLHLALTSVIGPTGGLRPAYVGAGAADRDLILGGPSTGLAVEGSRLDVGARIG